MRLKYFFSHCFISIIHHVLIADRSGSTASVGSRFAYPGLSKSDISSLRASVLKSLAPLDLPTKVTGLTQWLVDGVGTEEIPCVLTLVVIVMNRDGWFVPAIKGLERLLQALSVP